MNNLEIKEIFSSQAEAYKQFLAQGLKEDKESLVLTAEENASDPFPTRDRNDSFTLGAYADTVLAGVVSFVRDGENRVKLRHKGLLTTMYVLTEYRRHGIARALLEETIKRVKAVPGIEQINLIVLAGNARAKQFYAKFGFEKYGTEPNSLKWKNNYNAEDLMVLRLK